MKTKKIIAGALACAFAVLAFGENAGAKNFRSRNTFSVTGDQTNSDATTYYTGNEYQLWFYRRSSFPKLKMADPFAFRLFLQDDGSDGFGQENWSTMDRFFITNGNIWNLYGDSVEWEGETTYYPYAPGIYRTFSYYGGTKKKKKKRNAFNLFEFSPSGNEADADAAVQEDGDTTIYYYKKYVVPNLNVENLMDYRLFSRGSNRQGFSGEYWDIENSNFFIADGYVYLNIGYKTTDPGATFQASSARDYRLFTYSDGKRKGSSLKRQFVKKMAFNVPTDPGAADKVTTFTDADGYVSRDYYKKVSLKGVKMADIPSIQVMRKNNISEGFPDGSWSQMDYTVTNGNIWILFGYQITDPDGGTMGYRDTGSGDYEVFQYR